MALRDDRRLVRFACVLALIACSTQASASDNRLLAPIVHPDGSMTGVPTRVSGIVRESTESILQREARFPFGARAPRFKARNEIARRPRSESASPTLSWWPVLAGPGSAGSQPISPFRPSFSFDGPTLNEALAVPPDTMAAVGPTQVLVTLNGRFRVHDKATGAAGAFSVDPDVFFQPILTPNVGAAVTFTSDPRVRYDREAGRWVIVMIDVPNNGNDINRVLLAVSDGAVINAATVWTFFWFQSDNFADYPTLGLDSHALYIGLNMFAPGAGTFAGTNAVVVNKASILGTPGTPPNPIATAFNGILPDSSSAGPFTPQGVDNFDPNPTFGYFIGVDNASFGLLQLRRVATPGGTPTLSPNLPLAIPSTTFPLPQNHAGNTGGASGRIDAVDDRLMDAVIRQGSLWTAHAIGTGDTGAASSSPTRRNSLRWYQIGSDLSNTATSPTLVQAGTLFDPRPNSAGVTSSDRRGYLIPSISTNGQGHSLIGSSVAASDEFINAFAAGRLATDALGTLQLVDGSPANALPYTNATAAYSPTFDTGAGRGARRWGDYSYTTVDPCDDMTFWTTQQYTSASNVWGVRVARYNAPAPTLDACPSGARLLLAGTTTRITATGTGLFDPGSRFECRPRVSIAGAGVAVGALSVDAPTAVSFDATVAANATRGPRTLLFTNPDGQLASVTGCFRVEVDAVFRDGFEAP